MMQFRHARIGAEHAGELEARLLQFSTPRRYAVVSLGLLRSACYRAAEEEAEAKEEYSTLVFNLRQEHLRGLRELDVIHSLSVFKQRLLSRINDLFLTRAAEVAFYNPHMPYCTKGTMKHVI